jgi:hypothetical protein
LINPPCLFPTLQDPGRFYKPRRNLMKVLLLKWEFSSKGRFSLAFPPDYSAFGHNSKIPSMLFSIAGKPLKV